MDGPKEIREGILGPAFFMEFDMQMQKCFCCVAARRGAMLSAVAILALAFASDAFASGPLERVIYSFQGGNDGQSPQAALITDSAGNLYGTTLYGGDSSSCGSGCGTVFELSPPSTSGGSWKKTTLHSFQGGLHDGASPSGRLVFDKAGNLYGTTYYGGSDQYCYDKLILPGCGTVFELSPPATTGGAWTVTVLHAFPANSDDGTLPSSNLILDSAGNLYGTTEGIDPACYLPGGCGTVFELTPPATLGGPWSETVLHHFNGYGQDGAIPLALMFDHSGGLYGITHTGGPGCCALGTVFTLKREQGIWSENSLDVFDGGSGAESPTSLTLDNAGNLYAVAVAANNLSIVVELTPPAAPGEHWTSAMIYTFTGGKDGNGAMGLTVDKAGNLYGTTFEGGLKNSRTHDNGTIFRLSPPAVSGETSAEATLHEFAGSTYNDGSEARSGLTFAQGRLCGNTSAGGSAGFGTVFCLVIVP